HGHGQPAHAGRDRPRAPGVPLPRHGLAVVQRAAAAAALAALLAVPALADAQEVAPNRATTYLHPTDVRDARALWVNPAGLGVLRDASVYAEIAAQDPGARGRLRQLSAGFNARGLGFAYQRAVCGG